MRVLIGPSSFGFEDNSPMEKLLENGFEVTVNPFKRKLTKEELLNLLTDDTLGLIAGLEPLDRDVLESSTLRVISRVGTGLTNIDLKVAEKLGIKVCYTPSGPTTAVAELTIGTMLTLIRMVSQMDRDLHGNKWNKRIGFQLKGKTVAIIGFGRIGRKVAELLQPFNVDVIVVDPFLEEYINNYVFLPLAEALPQADIITIHSSGENCILGKREFAMLKKGVYLLNPARGGLVSESSLIEALNNSTVRGAWIDSFQNEPYSGPLINYDNVILTPHVGSYTIECRRKMEMEAVNKITWNKLSVP